MNLFGLKNIENTVTYQIGIRFNSEHAKVYDLSGKPFVTLLPERKNNELES